MVTPTDDIVASKEQTKLPRPFILRRLHSLLGLWLVIYLFEHLLVNSQAAFFLQDDGHGFVSLVNMIHNTPYLKAVEILFLGIPFLLHGIWGVVYLRSGKLNASKRAPNKPDLSMYKRNKAYSWQRITSWILLVGIILHVFQMRFLDYPTVIHAGDHRVYMTRVEQDPGLGITADKLGVVLYTPAALNEKEKELELLLKEGGEGPVWQNDVEEVQEWLEEATSRTLKPDQVLAVAPNAGSVFYLIVRNIFKSPLMVILYSIFVVAACYHGFNGLWTWMITWGITLSQKAQKRMRTITTALMFLVIFLGLLSAWGVYFTIQWQGS